MAFRHDGRRARQRRAGSAPASVHVWDLEREPGPKLHLKLPSQLIQGLAFDDMLTTMAVCETDGRTAWWDLETGKSASYLRLTDFNWIRQTPASRFSETGRYLAASGSDGQIAVWDVATGKRISLLANVERKVSKLRFFGADHRLIGLVHDPNTKKFGAVVWDVASGELQREIEFVGFVHTEHVQSIAIHPGSNILAIGADTTVSLHSLSTGELVNTLEVPGWKGALNFSADGEMLMCGINEGTASLWDWQTGTELQRFVGHDGPVRAVTLSPDGKTLATGDGAGHVRLWEPQSGQEMITFEAMMTDVQLLKFSADGQRLACWCRADGMSGASEVRVWSIER